LKKTHFFYRVLNIPNLQKNLQKKYFFVAEINKKQGEKIYKLQVLAKKTRRNTIKT